MRAYGQFCPIARASEILAERWTPIILRNLLYGCTTFSDLAAGAPGISRSLLSKRLTELASASVIDVIPKSDGNGSTYELTPAGRDLWRVLQAIGDWGIRWLELAPATASPDVVVWSWANGYLDHDRLPDRRVLVRFEFPDQPPTRRRLWLLVDDRDAEVCHKHPGFDEDLRVVVDEPRAFALWHLGQLEWGDVLRSGAVSITGSRELARSLPTWNRRRIPPAEVPPDGTWAVPSVDTAAWGPSSTIPEFAGELIGPSDEGYDHARRVWNGAIDRRPRWIARCATPGDVAACLRYALEEDLPISVRGGGHGVAGDAVCDDGLVIDLALMKTIEVDPARRTARAGAGVLWGELDTATQAFGLATTGGIVSHTGIAGLTLGGGIGWLMRRHGLTVDNLLSAEVVTADGRVITADSDHHQELFWGLRGGGSLGVVTSFSYRLHPVGPEILAGPVLWPLEDAGDVLRAYDAALAEAADEVATIVTLRKAPPLALLPIELHGRPVCIITMCYVGDPADGRSHLAPLRDISRPLLDLVDVRPYVTFQRMLDATVPHGWHYYWKSTNLRELSPGLIDTMIDRAAMVDSPRSYAVMFHLGGAVARVEPDATAFPDRLARHVLNINGVWLPDQHAAAERELAWTRGFYDAMRPHETGAYLNFLDRDDHDRIATLYGADALQRLVALKDRNDPGGILPWNITRPSGRMPSDPVPSIELDRTSGRGGTSDTCN